MAEHGSKGGILAKAQKQLVRTKTKVLQNLGKAERTTDETFDEYVNNLSKQQIAVLRLHKDLKNYIQNVKALSVASKTLFDAVLEIYELDWAEQSTFQTTIETYELLSTDYLQRLNEQVYDPVTKYLEKFPDFKSRIAKRGRKLVDFDNAKHNVDLIANAKKKDDAKIMKASEELSETKKIFDDVNNELRWELPSFHDSRLPFYASTFQSLFSAESTFHSEYGRLAETLVTAVEKLAKENQVEFQVNKVAVICGVKSLSDSESSFLGCTDDAYDDEDNGRIYHIPGEPLEVSTEAANKSDADENTSADRKHHCEVYENVKLPSPSPSPSRRSQSECITSNKPQPAQRITVYKFPDSIVDAKSSGTDSRNPRDGLGEYQVPTSNRPVKTPPAGFLYKVQTTHPYNSEDVDELDFNSGEIIYVVEHTSPDEQDDGWLMGIKDSDGKKGVFPENFTCHLNG